MATASAAGGDRPLAVLAAAKHVEAVGLHGVVAGPAEDDVAASVGHVDLVVARAGPDRVAPAAAGHPVVSAAGHDPVVPGAAVDHELAGTGRRDGVVARS